MKNLRQTTISIISRFSFWFIYSCAKINKANNTFDLIDFLIILKIKFNFFILLDEREEISSLIIDILIKLHFYSLFYLIFDADQEEKSVLTLNFELNLGF